MSTDPNQMIQTPDGWADLEARLRLIDPARVLGDTDLGRGVRARQAVEGARRRRMRPARLRLWGAVVGIGAVAVAAVFALLFVNRDESSVPADPLPDWVKLSILDRPQTPDDMPSRAFIASNNQLDLDWASSRLLYRSDGKSVYLVDDAKKDGLHCVLRDIGASLPDTDCFSLQSIAFFGAWVTSDGIIIVPDGIRTVTSPNGTRVHVRNNVTLRPVAGPYRLDGPAAGALRSGFPGSVFPQTETPRTRSTVTVWSHPRPRGRELPTGLIAPDRPFPVFDPDGRGSGQTINLARQRESEVISLAFPGDVARWRAEVPGPEADADEFGYLPDGLPFVVAEGVSRASLPQWAKTHSTRGTAILLDPDGVLRRAYGIGPDPERITILPSGVAERYVQGSVNWFASGVESATRISLADIKVGTPDPAVAPLVQRVSEAGHQWPAGCRPDPVNVTAIKLPSGRMALIGTHTGGGGLLSVVESGVVLSACIGREDGVTWAGFGALIVYIENPGDRNRQTAIGRVDPRYTSVTYRGKTTPLINGVFELEISEDFDTDFFLQFLGPGMPELAGPDGNSGLWPPHVESVKLR